MPNLHRYAALQILKEVRPLRDIQQEEMICFCDLLPEDRAAIQEEIPEYLKIFRMRDPDFRQSRRCDQPLQHHLHALCQHSLLCQTSQNDDDEPTCRGTKAQGVYTIICGLGKYDLRLLKGTPIKIVNKFSSKMQCIKSRDLLCGLFDDADICLYFVTTKAAGLAAWNSTFLPPAMESLHRHRHGLSLKSRNEQSILLRDLLDTQNAAMAYGSYLSSKAYNRRFRVDPEIDALLNQVDRCGDMYNAHQR